MKLIFLLNLIRKILEENISRKFCEEIGEKMQVFEIIIGETLNKLFKKQKCNQNFEFLEINFIFKNYLYEDLLKSCEEIL